MTVFSFQEVYRSYETGVDVLAGVSFQVQAGEVVGLLGRNGAGKTTLIRIAMGMMQAERGDVRLFGMDPGKDALAIRKRVGYVSEDQVLPAYLKVSDVIAFHQSLYPTWDRAMAKEMADRFQLPIRSRIRTLSKGQARQVALLCAVAHKPELLILDEPAGGLDPSARREFLETSINLLNEAGSTILFSSHHMTDVERMANRIVMLHDGKLLLNSELDHLQENYALAFIPHGTSVDGLKQLSGCLTVRQRPDAIHAVFAHPPQQTTALLEEAGYHGARCARTTLEELFIELAGGQ